VQDYPSVRISLVRHAQARARDDSYDEHTPLSVLGQSQAARIAEALLKRSAPQAIFASPYPRCVETAGPSCNALRLSARLDPRLREFEMETAPLAAMLLQPDLVIWESTHRGKAGGETLAEFSRRVSSCLEEIIEQHLGSEVVVFTHSGVIDAAIRWFVGLPHESAWMHDFPVSNASITEIEYWPRGRVEGGAPRYTALLRVADTNHLTDCWSET
jgi:ribonuclease H / adenosylcobalamin/alpha-ribazole phosphatase